MSLQALSNPQTDTQTDRLTRKVKKRFIRLFLWQLKKFLSLDVSAHERLSFVETMTDWDGRHEVGCRETRRDGQTSETAAARR